MRAEVRAALRRWFHSCRVPRACSEGVMWTCPTCRQRWRGEYVPDIVGVTDGLIDGGSDQWVKT